MLPKNRLPTHPGEILLEEFLKPLGITQTAFAEHIGVHLPALSELVRGRRGVSATMAWRLARALRTDAEFWMSLQAQYDLAAARGEASSVKPIRKAS